MGEAKLKLQQLLSDAIAAEGASKGNLQRYCKLSDELKIVVSQGFSPEFLEHFKVVKPFDLSSCGRAFGVGSTIVINDVEKDIAFKSHAAAARASGFRAVKSVPVFDSKGQKIGVLSTHFKDAKSKWDTGHLDDILSNIARVFEEYLLSGDNEVTETTLQSV